MKIAQTTWLVSLLWLVPAAAPAASPAATEPTVQTKPAPKKPQKYDLDYLGVFLPEQGLVKVSLVVRQSGQLLRRVRFEFDTERYRDFAGDGEVIVNGNQLTWRPPAEGGALNYSLVLDHQRRGGGFDSLMAEDWAIFRGDDLLPPAEALAGKGARSRARLRLSGPDGWSFFSAYPKSEEDSEWFVVDRPGRNFDRPVGWMAAGWLGVRWSKIGEVSVAVAGPTGQGVRHLDILAFLRWNLPALVEVFPEFPKRLLVVSAGDPMWRGGLSGPASLYLHAERPLISGNGTSTLLHELIHVAQGYRAAKDEDWIVEALAEYYTLEIMRRSGTISDARYERGFEKLGEWAEQAGSLEAEYSSGPRTAKGVKVMQALDAELRHRTRGKHSLDDVARRLAEDHRPVSVQQLQDVAAGLAGGPVEAISDEKLKQY